MTVLESFSGSARVARPLFSHYLLSLFLDKSRGLRRWLVISQGGRIADRALATLLASLTGHDPFPGFVKVTVREVLSTIGDQAWLIGVTGTVTCMPIRHTRASG